MNDTTFCHSRMFLSGIHMGGVVELSVGNGMKSYYVYILASKRNGTLYIGMTNDLLRRVYEHRNNLVEGFTKKHKVHQLVFFEQTNDVNVALNREKQIKKWNRKWKIDLIEKTNPAWRDLYDEII